MKIINFFTKNGMNTHFSTSSYKSQVLNSDSWTEYEVTAGCGEMGEIMDFIPTKSTVTPISNTPMSKNLSTCIMNYKLGILEG